ncbi:hypothetical protein EJB05_30900, partial [Eragrostis curvula]
MAHEKLGGFLAVPNVQELALTWNGSGEQLPERYIRTEEAGAVESIAGSGIPVVDLGMLLDPASSAEELAVLGAACQHSGFFQLINHGVPDEVIHDIRRDITEFFKLPLEAKKVHAQLPDRVEGYGQAFVFSETQKLDWADMLYLMVRPTESRNARFWPAQPPSFTDSVDKFSAEAARVASSLLRFMAADMGLEQPERLLEMFAGQPQTMRVTYYPPCREANKVIGLSPHSDATYLNLLLHVNEVQGLQIKKDGKWVSVDPMDGALVVNIGDILEILSNGRYKSIEHRAVVHPDKERISAAMFHQPCPNTTVGPLPELLKNGGRARYKSVDYAEYMKLFFSAKFDGLKSHFDGLRI